MEGKSAFAVLIEVVISDASATLLILAYNSESIEILLAQSSTPKSLFEIFLWTSATLPVSRLVFNVLTLSNTFWSLIAISIIIK